MYIYIHIYKYIYIYIYICKFTVVYFEKELRRNHEVVAKGIAIELRKWYNRIANEIQSSALQWRDAARRRYYKLRKGCERAVKELYIHALCIVVCSCFCNLVIYIHTWKIISFSFIIAGYNIYIYIDIYIDVYEY